MPEPNFDRDLEEPRTRSAPEVEAMGSESADRLRELGAHRWAHVRAAVAHNPSAPPDVLEVLVEDKHHLPRYGVAENSSLQARRIAVAAGDPWVRAILCRNSDLDEEMTAVLLQDPAREVRESLATSSRRPEVLSQLARDESPHVRSVAALNPALPQEDLEMLATDRIAKVRACAAQSRRLTEATVQGLANDRSASVRFELQHHRTGRKDLAESLADDPDDGVRDLAEEVLEGWQGSPDFL